jgi:hypothetical protein
MPEGADRQGNMFLIMARVGKKQKQKSKRSQSNTRTYICLGSRVYISQCKECTSKYNNSFYLASKGGVPFDRLTSKYDSYEIAN